MNIPRKSKPKSASRTARPLQSVLAQWRGVDLTDAEIQCEPSSQSIRALMPKVLSGLRIERRCAEAEILKVWNHLIDPNVVAHAHPTGLRKGTLFVVVDSSVWLNEIVRYRRREILERLQNSFGKDLITRISFQVG